MNANLASLFAWHMTKGARRYADERPVSHLGWFVNYLRPGSIGLGPSLNPNTNLRVDRFYERAASLLIRYQNLQIEATLKFHGGAPVSRVSCQMRPAETQSKVSSVSQFQRECNYAKYDTQYMHRERGCSLFVLKIRARSLQVKAPL